MNKRLKKDSGITLVVLVITIIILLILATISIQALTSTGLFENANKAKLETKRSQIKEWLSLNLMEAQTTNYNKTDLEILEIARQKAESREGLSKLGKTVSVDKELSTQEDGEIVDAYFYVIVDRDVYKVDISGAKFIGEQGKIPPKITLQNMTSTTNSITVKVKTSRNEGGNVEYYIKAEDEEKYELKETKTDDSEYTFINLIQGKKYNIKVIAKVENRPQAEVIVNQTTGKVTGMIIFNSLAWTNGKANIVISTNTNYLVQYQINTIEGNWITGTNVDGLSHGDVVYARLWDGVNAGINYAEQNILDGIEPNVSIDLNSKSATVETSVMAIVTQNDEQSGINIEKCKWTYNTISEELGTSESMYTGNFTGSKQSLTLQVKQAGTYYLHVLSVDKAGNAREVISETINVRKLTFAEKVQIGDYVAYSTGVHSYTSPQGTGLSHGNGYGNQTFTSNDSIKWRVLDKNVSTGEITLISENPIQTDSNTNFYLRGAIGYLYAEEELNKICSIYGHGVGANTSKTFSYEVGDVVEGVEGVEKRTLTGSGARSITVEDVNKICGVTPSTELNSNYGKEFTDTLYYPTRKTPTGKSISKASRTEKQTYYNYKGADKISTTSNEYKMLFKNVDTHNYWVYWLASRCVFSDTILSKLDVCCVESYYVYAYPVAVAMDKFGDSSWDDHNHYGVRPVVYLKSDIQTSGKDSSGAWKIE